MKYWVFSAEQLDKAIVLYMTRMANEASPEKRTIFEDQHQKVRGVILRVMHILFIGQRIYSFNEQQLDEAILKYALAIKHGDPEFDTDVCIDELDYCIKDFLHSPEVMTLKMIKGLNHAG